MSTDASVMDMSGAREVYELLNQLDRHINGKDASGRALLYQAKEAAADAHYQHRQSERGLSPRQHARN